MMFSELFTAVPNKKLNDICTQLEIPYDDKTQYLVKQRKIRTLTDAYLKENNLYNVVDENDKVSLAWWII